MAAENGLRFDDNFVDLPGLGDASQSPTLLNTSPTNPLYELIDSDRYIQSLENKLKNLKGRKQKEPTAKEMIKSLTVSKEAHFRNVDNERDTYCSNYVPSSSDIDKSYSVLQRKMHPDRVAIDPEELVELLHDNDVEKCAESKLDQVLTQPTCSSSNSTTNSMETTRQSHVLPKCTLPNSNTSSESDSLTHNVESVKNSSVKSKLANTSSVSNATLSEDNTGQSKESNTQIKSQRDGAVQ